MPRQHVQGQDEGARPRSSRRGLVQGLAQVAVLVLIATAAAVGAGAAPASADHGRCGLHSEQEYLNETRTLCRGTDVVAPPVGEFLDRNDLLAQLPLYGQYGFDRSFMWFAPRQQVWTDGLEWGYCASDAYDNNGSDDVCDDAGERIVFERASAAFGANTQVTVLGDRGAFIALVCGNNSRLGRSYHPQLSGTKFHDRDADGVRSDGDEVLAGWQFRVTLLEGALAGQPVGESKVVTSGADGRWSLDLYSTGPGRYSVEELPRDGWRVTNGPRTREVHVAPGVGDATVDAGSWGNVREADTAKTEFRLLDPPPRIDADVTTPLTVRVALTNHGPAPVVEVRDEIAVTGEPDCTVTPASRTIRSSLALGETQVFDVAFDVLCTDPSHHPFTFTDTLVAGGDVRELRPENNSASFTHSIEVFDDSDIALVDADLDCSDRTMVHQTFFCAGSAVVTNLGPYGPTSTDVDLSLTAPGDCTITATGTNRVEQSALAVGHALTVDGTWEVTCTERSFHPLELRATAAPDHLHVEDEDRLGGVNLASAGDTTEVFEAVDLEVVVDDLRCSEREASRLTSSCVATITVSNAGPATAVATLAVLELAPESTCTATPERVQFAQTVDAGRSRTLTQDFDLVCTSNVRHATSVTATLTNAPSDPHAVDSDSDSVLWLPSDAKPRSLPSSVNVGKQGTLPFALLATEQVDPLVDVDRSSLRYGVTGREDSVTGCKSEGEDVDEDGRVDLICHADTLLTGVHCKTDVLIATGRLNDGTRFVAQDDVHVTGCRHNL